MQSFSSTWVPQVLVWHHCHHVFERSWTRQSRPSPFFPRELFELCETIPKVQCSECLLFRNQGIVYCTCGHLLKESESSQHFHQWRLDAFSIQHYVITKVRPRGARHGKTEAQKEHFIAHNARKRCIKRDYEGIHDRFLRDPVYRDSQLKIGWTEEKCIEMDKLAQKDHPYRLSHEEYLRYQKMVSHIKQIGKECTDATSIRLPSRSHNHEPSPPRIWRRATCTNSSVPVSEMAFVFFFFFQHLMVSVERFLVEFIKFIKIIKSSTSEHVKERHHRTGRPVVRLLYQAAQK